jgi:hypothetical protein
MPTYVASISFYNRAALMGEFDSRSDDAEVNEVLDVLREADATIERIDVNSSGGFFKYVMTYVILYDAEKPIPV